MIFIRIVDKNINTIYNKKLTKKCMTKIIFSNYNKY